MDREAIEERIKILNELMQKTAQERDNAILRVAAIQGALEDCNFWLSAMTPPQAVTPEG